jgi:WD40 repeat protein
MPEARLEKKIFDPEKAIGANGGPQVSADAVMSAFEQICMAMSASGAVVAVRDVNGVRCVVSFGNAPSVGSRLQPDSVFTRECIEKDTVVLSEDTQNDQRVHPGTAKSLNLRSAVAVPIHAQGSVVGLIEVFSARPYSISPTAIGALQRVAELFANIMIFEPGPQGELVIAPPLAWTQAQTPNAIVEAPKDTERVDEGFSSSHLGSSSAISSELKDVLSPGGKAVPSVEQVGLRSQRSQDSPAASRLRWIVPTTPQSRAWLFGAVCVAILPFVVALIISGRRSGKLSRAKSPGLVADRGVGATDRADLRGLENDKASASTVRRRVPSVTTAPSANSVPSPKFDTANSPITADNHEVGVVAAGSRVGSSVATGSGTEAGNDVARRFRPPRPRFNLSETRRSDAVLASPTAAEMSSFGLPTLLGETAKSDALNSAASPVSPNKPIRVRGPDFVLDRTLKGHFDWVTAVAFNPSGVLASGSWDQTVKFWDVVTGRELQGPSGKVKKVQALAFSRDGRWLAAENSSDAVTVWDTATGSEVRTLLSDKRQPPIGTNWVYSIAFSPDGRWLASGLDDKTVRIWDASTGRPIHDLAGHHRSVIYIAVSPDGRLLATGNDEKTIEIWDTSTGREVRTLSGHKRLVFAVAFSPNGQQLASASADKTVKLWDVATGREIRSLSGHQGEVTSLAFSADGRWLASGSWDKTVKVWDVATGNMMQTLGGGSRSVYAVAFDFAAQWLASGTEDGKVNVWRLKDGARSPGSRANANP